MIETLDTGIPSPRLPTLADIEQRTEDLLAQPPTPSRPATSVADPASPPTAALPTPEPLRPKEPQHTLRSIFDYEDPEPAEEETAEPEESHWEET